MCSKNFCLLVMTVTHYLLSHFSRFSVSQCLKMWPLKRHFCFHLCVFGLALFQQYARTLWKSSGRGLVCKNENCIWISTGMIPLCFVYAQMAFVEEKESRSLTMQTCGSVCWLYVKSLALLKGTLTKKKKFLKSRQSVLTVSHNGVSAYQCEKQILCCD